MYKQEFGYTIKVFPTKNIAGLIILKHIDWQKKQGEFAYCIGKKHEGQGWMTEAIVASSQFAIENLGLKTLQIIAHKNNFGSVKVAEKSGYIWKKTLKKVFAPINEPPLDMELFELTNER